MERELVWELDRQVVLAQLQNVILALRSNSRFGSKNRFFAVTPSQQQQQPAEHPLLQGAVDLHNQLLFCSAPAMLISASGMAAPAAPGSKAARGTSDTHVDLNASIASVQSAGTAAEGSRASEADVTRSLRASMQRALSEEDILTPFCAVCRSSDVSETIASVAVAGLVAILSRPCAFVSVKGLRIALESIAITRATGKSSSHEVLIARIVQAYMACIAHPAAAELTEESYVRVVSRTLVLALRPETSPLLKRTAENAMNTIVTTLYHRVVANTSTASGASHVSEVPQLSGSFSMPAPSAEMNGVPNTVPPTSLDGTSMMRYISALISGEVTALDSEGNTISSSGNEVASGGSGSSPEGKGSRQGGGSGANAIVVYDSGPAIQLEGLWLAQAALFTVSRHLNDSKARRLRSAVQNDLSRALLVAGIGTSHVVVLSQILRTIHIAVKCAAHHLVPQMLSFLRILHLGPLATLTEELNRAEASSSAGSGGFFGGGGSTRYASPSPQGVSSPIGLGSPTAGSYLSSSQVMDMYERKEILLESLAEFCSDPNFLSFCYAHFDLSWHHTPILPQLCDVLVSCACVMGEGDGVDRDGRDGNDRGSSGGTGSRAPSPPYAQKEVSSAPRRAMRPLNRLQLVALDAAANMVSEIAFRTMTPTSTTSSSAVSSALTPRMTAGVAPRTPPSLPAAVATGSSGIAGPVGNSFSRACVEEGVTHMIAQKKLLMEFASLFEASPHKKGIPFLLENAVRVDSVEAEAAAARRGKTWFVVCNPAGGREIGHTLFRLSVLLDKRALGDHIGDLGRERTPKPGAEETAAVLPDGSLVTNAADVAAIIAALGDEAGGAATAAGTSGAEDSAGTTAERLVAANGTRLVPARELWEQARASDHLIVGTVRFYEEQLRGFIEMFDFRGKPLLAAIREMVYRLCLPGESQKIDRIMEAFAKHWYAQNAEDKAVNPFHSDSGAFVLSFAIIMLNTTLHSKRLDRSLTLADFKSMNRGIDDGNNVPEEYLTNVYEDVQKHEVIMAEMMDRGFANDVTWDLEMNSVQDRAFHGVDGTLPGVLALMGEGVEEGTTHSTPQKSEGPADSTETVVAARAGGTEVLRRVLDPYIFDAVWKRCLLVFTSMTETSGWQVSRLSPRGETMRDAISHARALMPTEVATLLSSLRGIQMLSRAAHNLHVPGAADQCMLTLLPHVQLELSNAQDVVDGLYRSLPKLLCTREIFTLLRATASSLADSWPLLSEFVLNLYLLGFFALPHTDDGKGDAADAPRRRGHAPLPEVLTANPGIVDSDPVAQKRAAAPESGGGGGGWFSSFFGGGGGEAAPNGNGAGGLAAELSAITSQPRVRECIPDMAQLLRMLGSLPPAALARMLQALVENRSHVSWQQLPSQQPPRLTTQEGFILSYEACLATAVAFAGVPRAATAMVLQSPASHADAVPGATTPAELPSPSRQPSQAAAAEASGALMDTFLPYLQVTLARTLAAAEGSSGQSGRQRGTWNNGSGASANGGTGTDPVQTFWVGTGDRMISGILCVMAYALRVQYQKSVSSCTQTGYGVSAPSAMLESVWRVLHVFLELPHGLFNRFAALPVAAFLEDWADALATAQRETGALPPTALESHMLVPLVSRAAVSLDRHVNPAALAALCRTSHTVAAHQLYELGQQTEIFVDAILTLGSLRGQQEEGVVRAGRASQTPVSSVTSRASNTGRGGLGNQSSTPSAELMGSPSHTPPPSEIVGLCCRNVLHAARECQRLAESDESSATDMAAWLQLWIFCLRRLAGLVLCAGSPRAGSEGLLSLQRALQDTELKSLPAATVEAIYNDVLFPLVELVCAPGSEVRPASATPPPAAALKAPAGRLPSGDSTASAAPAASAKEGGASAGFLAAVFGAVPATEPGESSTLATGVPASARQSSLMPILPAEVKCRVVNLLPKVLLQYASSLVEYPELLQDLWQRVLGTLYAVYTAFPAPGAHPVSSSSRARAASGDVEDELISDEAGVMREAVEETVKNMVYVVAAMGAESDSVLQRVPFFSTSTRNLIRPFSFAGPLLAFLDSVEGVEGNPDQS